jgi:hypothetical protein
LGFVVSSVGVDAGSEAFICEAVPRFAAAFAGDLLAFAGGITCSATRRMAGQRHPDGRSLRIIKMA